MSFFARGHREVTVTRYVVETLFIIIDRYVKLYIFDHVKLYMLGLWRFSIIALNRDVIGRSHFIEIISHFFSILSSVKSTSIHVRVLYGVTNNVPFFGKNSKCYALAYQSTHMRSA